MFNKELFGQLENSLMVNYSIQIGYVYAEKGGWIFVIFAIYRVS